jgi:GGDEF domain-containing protein
LKEKKPKDIDIVFRLRENLRSADVISPVDEDFIFLFLPETDKKQISALIERLRKVTEINFVEGVVSYPEDGKTARELFDKMVQIMNDKLIPIIEI